MRSCVQLFVTPWTVAHQAPLSMGFSRQGYWSGLPCPSPGDLPDPGTEPASPSFPAPASGFFITEPSVEDPICLMTKILKQKQYCNKFNKDFKSGPHQKKIFKIEIQIPMKNFCFYKLLQMELNHFPHFFSSAPVTSTFSLESSTSLSPILSSTGRTCSLGPRKPRLYTVWSLLATQPHPVPHFLSHFPSFGHIRGLFYCPNLCLAFLVALFWRFRYA